MRLAHRPAGGRPAADPRPVIRRGGAGLFDDRVDDACELHGSGDERRVAAGDFHGFDAEALTGRVVRAVHKDEIHDGLRGTESAPAFLKSTPGVG